MKRLRFACVFLCLFVNSSLFACRVDVAPSDVPGAQAGDAAMALRVRQAMAAPSPSLRIVRLSEVFEDLSPENVTEVVDLYQREISMVSPGEMAVLLDSWSGFDPQGAYEFTVSLPKSKRREDAMGVAMQAWALRDPEGAKARTEADLKRRREVYVSPSTLEENLTIGWSHSGQPGLLDYLSQQGDASRVLSLRAFVGAETRRQGTKPFLESMTEFFQTPDDTPEGRRFKKQVLIALVAVSAKREPEFTSQWLNRFDSRAYAGLEGEKRVAWYWLPQDPEATFEWVQTAFPAPEGEKVLIDSFERWLKQSEGGALAWLDAGEGPALLQDYGNYVNAMRPGLPAGLDLVRRTDAIQTESLRRPALVSVLTRWYAKEPIYAESWLQSSELPEPVRESIRKEAVKPWRPPGRPE